MHHHLGLKSIVVGGILAYGGLLLSVHLRHLLGVEAKWAYELLLVICITPTALYADWVRAIPGTSTTLVVWLWYAAGCAIWLAFQWLHVAVLPLAVNVGWFARLAGFAVSILLSKQIYAWFLRRHDKTVAAIVE